MKQVLLLNTLRNNANLIVPGSMSLAPVTIHDALKMRGIKDVGLHPKAVRPAAKWRENVQCLVDEVREPKETIIGVSAYSDEHVNVVEQLVELRRLCPEATIIVGGPHMVREESNPHDPISHFLKNGLTDAAVYGDCGPFVDLIAENNGVIEGFKAPGFYSLGKGGEVIGNGYGEFPHLNVMPYTLIQLPDGLKLGTQLDMSCRNRCGFCALTKRRPKISPELQATLYAILKFEFAKVDFGYLTLYDSNPTEGKKLAGYDLLFGALKGKTILKTMYLEPHALVERYGEVLRFIKKHHVYQMFLGRDCTTGNAAAFAQRRFAGRLKTQEMLDAELVAIMRLIKDCRDWWLGERHKIPGSKKHDLEIALSYMLTPVDTIETVKRMLAEWAELKKHNREGFNVNPHYSLLTPYFGCDIRKVHADMLKDQADLSILGLAKNSWKLAGGSGEICPGSVIMEIDAANPKLPLKAVVKKAEEYMKAQGQVGVGN